VRVDGCGDGVGCAAPYCVICTPRHRSQSANDTENIRQLLQRKANAEGFFATLRYRTGGAISGHGWVDFRPGGSGCRDIDLSAVALLNA
jgi:hypothetical protein